jgi:predicted hydrolase (HD superfamily)
MSTMTREQALKLLHSKMQNTNLRRHCYAVEAVMGALYKRLENHHQTKEGEEKWRIVGLLHDGDYEETKATPELHTIRMAEWLKKEGVTDKELLDAILSHNFAHTGQNEPKNNLEWSLYCCDELTGLIVAVALVKEGKLANVTVESVENKWNKLAFAGGVDRKQIEKCEERLGIPLHEFIEIALTAMQNVHDELGL